MFKKLMLLVVMLGTVASAQEALMQQLKETVAFVYGTAHVKDQNGRTHLLEGTLGTAFFVLYPDSRGGENYGFTYVVTAKHVLRDEEEKKYLDKARIRMNNIGDSGVGFIDLDVSDQNGNLKWFDDKEDSNSDIAVFLCHPDETHFAYKDIPLKMFVDTNFLKQNMVSEGDQVYLIGLMPQFTGERHNYPIVRHGYVALLADEPVALGPNVKENVYALELGSWPGQSGSPVFLSLGGLRSGGRMLIGDSYSLMGLMLGDFGLLFILLGAIAGLLLFIAVHVSSISSRLKERFPTAKEEDYKWSQDDPMGITKHTKTTKIKSSPLPKTGSASV